MMLDLRNGPKEKLSDANAPQSLEVNGLAIVWKFLFQTNLITEQISILKVMHFHLITYIVVHNLCLIY